MIDEYFKQQRKNLLIERWNRLGDVSDILTVASPDYQDPQKYFEDLILNEENEELAEKRIRVIENIKIQDNSERKQRDLEQQKKKVDLERKQLLYLSDWTQLADSPLSTKEKLEYREYRNYLRDLFVLYKRKQIIRLETMTFEEWQKNKPHYKR